MLRHLSQPSFLKLQVECDVERHHTPEHYRGQDDHHQNRVLDNLHLLLFQYLVWCVGIWLKPRDEGIGNRPSYQTGEPNDVKLPKGEPEVLPPCENLSCHCDQEHRHASGEKANSEL